MRPRKEPPTIAPPAKKPVPFSARHTGAEGEHMRRERRRAERTTTPWGVEVPHDERGYSYDGVPGNKVRLPERPE